MPESAHRSASSIEVSEESADGLDVLDEQYITIDGEKFPETSDTTFAWSKCRVHKRGIPISAWAEIVL